MARDVDRGDNTRHRMLDDLLQTRIAAIEEFSQSVAESLNQRISLLQDVANLSLVVLGGITTLTILADKKIKTHILFYLGEVGLLLCVIFAFVIRIKILRARSELTNALRDREDDLRNAIGLYKYHDTEHHGEAEHTYHEVMSEELNIPKPPVLITTGAIAILVATFITSLIIIGLSLLFHISV